ncbi:MAG TPA: hypothetical protein VGI92_04475 [Gemmatimonadales bacterium]|jgi:hypothetical protein
MLALAVAALVAFQCPDGSPPPCGRSSSSIAGRVPSLALNDNTWLILPFENTARTADAELIRQASVSQLTGELSRWNGVRTISDDRVADLLQQLPASQRDRPGLESATTLARRVGAGRIVLGNYLALGGKATITAKVYETRTGREIRVARDAMSGFQSAAALDSLSASFGRLAGSMLDVPAGSGNASQGVGTSSMEAYRAYVAGMEAVNRIQVDSADRSFDRAIRLDSNFALAHFQRWRFTTDSVARAPYLAAAMRLSGSLPVRARALVEGLNAARHGAREELCTAANQIVAADSSDAEGWTLLSTCYKDPTLLIDGGRPRLRSGPTRTLRAAERAYALTPNSVTSASALLGALQQTSYMQCVPANTSGLCPLDQNYLVSIVPAGDTLAAVITPWAEARHGSADDDPNSVEAFVQRLRRAIAVCQRLLATSDTRVVHRAIAQFALAIGDITTAQDNLGKGAASQLDSNTNAINETLQAHFDLALAQEQPAIFQAYADSLIARDALSGPLRSMLGHLGEGNDTTAALRQNALWRQILVGVIPAGFDSLERQMTARMTEPARDDYLQLTTLAGFHLRHNGPALDTAAISPLKRYQAWFARGDTARARVALREFDRKLVTRHPDSPDDGGWLFSAESHVEFGDSAVALQRMQEFGRRWAAEIPFAYIMEMRYFQSTTPRLWGRAWLLYGDLAKARGQRDEAKRAYRMVVGLWERGDPVVQPAVARAKTALAQLGG